VVDLDIGPRLAVLMGCATAIGLDDEFWGALPSAFLAAGSRHVVATFRTVEDRQAARVTEAYYAQASLASPIHRLAAAQRELIGLLPVAAWASFGAWGNAECAP
jgi:CHAT domain-containing protein